MRSAISRCAVMVSVKHLNPRQGITTPGRRHSRPPPRRSRWCETPKSPPGDYNSAAGAAGAARLFSCVKHLNPRQGITIWQCGLHLRTSTTRECETPKSPPGDYNETMTDPLLTMVRLRCETPKSPPGDYNRVARGAFFSFPHLGVKHLNPRQGITTLIAGALVDGSQDACETPKSPPGDYNAGRIRPPPGGNRSEV